MKDTSNINSLISYLGPAGSKFYLNLFGTDQIHLLPGEILFPYTVISDSDPLARLIEAKLVSDAGSEIKKLILFVQRDHYDLKSNALWPFNNMDVTKVWQKSFDFHTDNHREDMPFVLLSGQLGKEGDIRSFTSLFYCKTKKAFFHPPCPNCGRTLRQCEDDHVLNASGLQPFSTSLKRYLFCSACGAPDFYAYEREQSDPPSVKDCRSLIRNFAGLKNAEEATVFPCADCQFQVECYDNDNRAGERIVPFAFYPFYMLAFEAASLTAVDFITLLSGADFQEIQAQAEKNREGGKVASLKALSGFCMDGNPFLFDHDERFFLEILYLKLAFLEQVVRGFQSGGRLTHPGLKPGIDQIWVKFPETSAMLPRFWNFKVRVLGIGHEEPNPVPFDMTSDAGVMLGLIWLYTLLVNKQQNMTDIVRCLKKVSPEDPGAFEKIAKEAVFDAPNIFWDPHGKDVHAAWRSLWEKSLRMAWLLMASSRQTVDDAPDKFLEQLAQLRTDIKENLFIKEIPCAAHEQERVETVPSRTEDEIIHGILLGLIDKIRSEGREMKQAETVEAHDADKSTMVEKQKVSPALPVAEDMEEPVTETVIFSARQTRAGELPSARETQIIAQDRPSREVPMESQETVILSVKDLEPGTQSKTKQTDVLEETLILSVPPAAKAPLVAPSEKLPKAPPAFSGGEVPIESQETLILSVGELAAQTPKKTEKAAPVLDETVIISTLTGKTAREVEKEKNVTAQKKTIQDSLLEETIILRPGEKSKDGAKK